MEVNPAVAPVMFDPPTHHELKEKLRQHREMLSQGDLLINKILADIEEKAIREAKRIQRDLYKNWRL